MILVDTSIWIDHLRRTEAGLVALLEEAQVCAHPMIISEWRSYHFKIVRRFSRCSLIFQAYQLRLMQKC